MPDDPKVEIIIEEGASLQRMLEQMFPDESELKGAFDDDHKYIWQILVNGKVLSGGTAASKEQAQEHVDNVLNFMNGLKIREYLSE